MKHNIPNIEEIIGTDFLLIEDTSEWNGKSDRPVFLKRDGEVYYLSEPVRNNDGSQEPVWTKTVSLFKNKSMPDIVRIMAIHPKALIEDEAYQTIGYLAASDLMQALFESYQHLKAYFETMIETMDASISLIDEEGKVAVWTSGAEQIFSIKSKDIIGKPITDFFTVDMLQTLKTLQTGQSVFRNQHQPRPDLFVLINTNPIRLDGKIIGAVASEVDITTQIRLHHELLNVTSQVHHLKKEVAKLSPSNDPFANIAGTSHAIKQTIETSKKISTTKATVLISGESGVGKELFAKAIHDSRENPGAPFIAINCGAIPSSLFESELFGYERGAFSGADQKGKKGLIELARGGTLFLDEIGEVPLDMQVKLLRVLQERKYFPVGGTNLINVDSRIISATNRDLNELVNQRKFREDLYYRLNVITVEVPPLRQRKEDIFELTKAFLYELSLLYNRYIEDIPHDLMQDLLNYDWPGNVRELRNTIERLVVLTTDGRVSREYLPGTIYKHPEDYKQPSSASSQSLVKAIQSFERKLILEAIELEGGNKLAAAKRLGISRPGLYNKLNKLGKG